MMAILFVYCFTSHSRIFHLNGDVTIAGEGLQNLGLCSHSGLWAEGSSPCHTCCDTGPSFFWSRLKDRPHSVVSYDTQGVFGGPNLTWIFKGRYGHIEIWICFYKWNTSVIPLKTFKQSLVIAKLLTFFKFLILYQPIKS
jgi:hypothetical protein